VTVRSNLNDRASISTREGLANRVLDRIETTSKSMAPVGTAAVFVVFFVMAWSPFRPSPAVIGWVEHPGDYANRISTTLATAPAIQRSTTNIGVSIPTSRGCPRDVAGVPRYQPSTR